MMIADFICVTLSCAIMTLYLTAYILNVGLPSSISETYYHTEAKWLFPTSTATAGALALVPLMNITPRQLSVCCFLYCRFHIVCGGRSCIPRGTDKHGTQRSRHNTGCVGICMAHTDKRSAIHSNHSNTGRTTV